MRVADVLACAAAAAGPISRTMRITATLFAAVLLLTGCKDREPLASDSELRQRLTGTWTVEVRDPDGSSPTKGTSRIAEDGSFADEFLIQVANETRRVTTRGFVQIKDGSLIVTITNAVRHWLPEPERGALPAGGLTTSLKIIRLNDNELVLNEGGSFSTTVYTKNRK